MFQSNEPVPAGMAGKELTADTPCYSEIWPAIDLIGRSPGPMAALNSFKVYLIILRSHSGCHTPLQREQGAASWNLLELLKLLKHLKMLAPRERSRDPCSKTEW